MARWTAILLAWVAWTHSIFLSKGIDRWEPLGAVQSLDECKQAAVTAAGNSVRKLRAQDENTVFAHEGMLIEMTYSSGEKASIVFVCLPDTLDPRGSKK